MLSGLFIYEAICRDTANIKYLYENQEIEKDANYFADSVMKKGINSNYA